MVYKKRDEGTSRKRGRPVKKEPEQPAPKRKTRSKVLDDTGPESGIERGFIEVSPEQSLPSKENEIDASGITMQLSPEAVNTVNKIVEEKENTTQDKDQKESETIESLDFSSGSNKLSIRLTKKHNRMFRVQIFLNDGQLEVRPMTYTGSNTAMAFWNLLKGALK